MHQLLCLDENHHHSEVSEPHAQSTAWVHKCGSASTTIRLPPTAICSVVIHTCTHTQLWGPQSAVWRPSLLQFLPLISPTEQLMGGFPCGLPISYWAAAWRSWSHGTADQRPAPISSLKGYKLQTAAYPHPIHHLQKNDLWISTYKADVCGFARLYTCNTFLITGDHMASALQPLQTKQFEILQCLILFLICDAYKKANAHLGALWLFPCCRNGNPHSLTNCSNCAAQRWTFQPCARQDTPF